MAVELLVHGILFLEIEVLFKLRDIISIEGVLARAAGGLRSIYVRRVSKDRKVVKYLVEAVGMF